MGAGDDGRRPGATTRGVRLRAGRMTNDTFVYRSRMPAIAPEVFAWHMRRGAFQRLAPPWDHLRVLDDGNPIGEGSRAEIELSLGPLRRRWTAEHRDIEPGHRFRDVQ